MEKCVYCGRDLPELPYKVKVHTRSFDVCCKECSEQAAHYVKQDKRFKTALRVVWALCSAHSSAEKARCV